MTTPPRARRSSARSSASLAFDGEDEAIARANDTLYGLSGSIWTADGARAMRVARALEIGALAINSYTSVRVGTPFGGFKQSGVGRELGRGRRRGLHRAQERVPGDVGPARSRVSAMGAERRVPVWVAVLLCLGGGRGDHAAVDGTAVGAFARHVQ